MLWNLHASWTRKFSLSLLLFPGVFVIAAALIRLVMSMQNSPSALNINRWGVRETLAGIIAVNVPILRPMLRSAFWSRGPMLTSQKKSSSTSAFADGSDGQKRRTWASSSAPFQRVGSRVAVDPERQGGDGGLQQTKGGVVLEMEDRSSIHSRGSGANSEEYIIKRTPTLPRYDQAGRDEIRVETSFGSSVEYQHQKESAPEVPWGNPHDKPQYVSSVTCASERD